MSTRITASTIPPTAPPTIAPMGTGEPLLDGRGDGIEVPFENTVSVTTCTPLGVEDEDGDCCEDMRE